MSKSIGAVVNVASGGADVRARDRLFAAHFEAQLVTTAGAVETIVALRAFTFVCGLCVPRRIDNFEIMFDHWLVRESNEAPCNPCSGFYSVWFELIESACGAGPFETQPMAKALSKAGQEPR